MSGVCGLFGFGLFLLRAAISLSGAMVHRMRTQRAMLQELSGKTTHTRRCERCDGTELEVSGSTVWCARCGTSG